MKTSHHGLKEKNPNEDQKWSSALKGSSSKFPHANKKINSRNYHLWYCKAIKVSFNEDHAVKSVRWSLYKLVIVPGQTQAEHTHSLS